MKYIKIYTIIFFCFLFGFFQAFELGILTFNQITGSSIVPLILIIPASLLLEIISFIKKRNFSFERFQVRLWKISIYVFIFIIIVYGVEYLGRFLNINRTA